MVWVLLVVIAQPMGRSARDPASRSATPTRSSPTALTQPAEHPAPPPASGLDRYSDSPAWWEPLGEAIVLSILTSVAAWLMFRRKTPGRSGDTAAMDTRQQDIASTREKPKVRLSAEETETRRNGEFRVRLTNESTGPIRVWIPGSFLLELAIRRIDERLYRLGLLLKAVTVDGAEVYRLRRTEERFAVKIADWCEIACLVLHEGGAPPTRFEMGESLREVPLECNVIVTCAYMYEGDPHTVKKTFACSITSFTSR